MQIPASYGWSHFHRQNELIAALIRTRFPSIVFLDVEYMTSFRADSHKDYVHPCIPGWADWWLVLISHALILLDA
jgi:hypothetical protein